MNRIITQSVFAAAPAPRFAWQGYLTSGLVHFVLIALVLSISIPAVREMNHPRESITFIASPPSPASHPRLNFPRNTHPPRLVIAKLIPPKPIPEIKPSPVRVEIKPPVIAAALPPKELPVARLMPPIAERAAPKPPVNTGVFGTAETAKGPQTEKQVKIGGFGDPQGVPASNAAASKSNLARVGSFDLPEGEGRGGSGGSARIGLHQTSFASPGEGAGSVASAGNHGSVQTGGFGDSAGPSAAAHAEPAKPAQPAATSVEILFKPKPVYTEEARNLRLEGRVSLEVVFLATGSVRLIRVLRGLGHGLDEAAEAAAMQVRFRPATRAGVPVDTVGTIYITFELA